MNKRIVSVLCCFPLLIGNITDRPLEKSNLSNKFKTTIKDIQYPLQDERSKINRIKEKADKLRKQQIMKEIGEGFKKLKYEEDDQKRKQQQIANRELNGNVEKVDFILSFYTNLPEENGGHTITCNGEKLRYGMVASNVYPLGTKINIKGYGTFTVSDRGGSNFNSHNRLDVLIERNGGESDSEYLNRVNNMGKPVVTGYIENKKNK